MSRKPLSAVRIAERVVAGWFDGLLRDPDALGVQGADVHFDSDDAVEQVRNAVEREWIAEHGPAKELDDYRSVHLAIHAGYLIGVQVGLRLRNVQVGLRLRNGGRHAA